MNWRRDDSEYWALSAELLFQYHKLEKGLCIPGDKRFFGYDAASEVLRLLSKWRDRGFSIENSVYVGAVETLRAYRKRLDETPPARGARLIAALDREIHSSGHPRKEFETPNSVCRLNSSGVAEMLQALALARRSVRNFAPTPIAREDIVKAVKLAQLSPSACNRQPCRVHVYQDRAKIDRLLALQNGNRGFGHTIPTLLILTAEGSGFFDASERFQPYIDGGLFGMSLLFALQAEGLSTCCLNWCVEPESDRAAHECGAIPVSERIIMYIALGIAQDAALVPKSPRRDISDVLVMKDETEAMTTVFDAERTST